MSKQSFKRQEVVLRSDLTLPPMALTLVRNRDGLADKIRVKDEF